MKDLYRLFFYPWVKLNTGMQEQTRPARPWSGLDFQIGSHPILSYICVYNSMIIIFFSLTVISIDKSGFVSLLPNFFLFTVSLIAGSRALSHLPILVCISVSNVVPACIYLLDNVSLKKSSVVQLISSFVVIATAVPILLCAVHVIFEMFWLASNIEIVVKIWIFIYFLIFF